MNLNEPKLTLNDNKIVIEKIYSVTIQKVWDALTKPDQMRNWYFDLNDFEPKVGYEFQF